MSGVLVDRDTLEQLLTNVLLEDAGDGGADWCRDCGRSVSPTLPHGPLCVVPGVLSALALPAQAAADAAEGCDACTQVKDNMGEINYCYRCGRKFPEHVPTTMTFEELIAQEGPKWRDVDPVGFVRAMRDGGTDLTTLAEDACLSKVTLTLDRLARSEEWVADVEFDRVGFAGRGDTPEAALVEAIVDKGIGDYYYAADWDGPKLTTEQMTERLHAAYREHLGFTPEHGYRGDYLNR